MEKDEEVVEVGEDFISICVGDAQWMSGDGRFILEEDYRVGGEVWRVHKNDADPLPSNPHAHCIDGKRRFVGCKLHLGTRELYDSKNKPLGRFLQQTQFDRLIELAQKKFPEIKLPLSN